MSTDPLLEVGPYSNSRCQLIEVKYQDLLASLYQQLCSRDSSLRAECLEAGL